MLTLRTLIAIGLVLVLAGGASAAGKSGRPGNLARGKGQHGNRMKGVQNIHGTATYGDAGEQMTGRFGPSGPRRATNEEIIKALNNGTQLKAMP